MSEFKWKYEEHDDSTLHPAGKVYMEGGSLFCTECECAVADHVPKQDKVDIEYTITFKSQNLRELERAMQIVGQGRFSRIEGTAEVLTVYEEEA